MLVNRRLNRTPKLILDFNSFIAYILIGFDTYISLVSFIKLF